MFQKKNLHKENEEDAKNVFVRTEKRGVTLQSVSNFCVLNMSIYFQVNASMAMTFIYKYLLTLSCSIFEKKVTIYLLHILLFVGTLIWFLELINTF
jgi:hypothetical protein